ncbi:MAG: ATP-binding cassette domain-containing protein [Propionibacteriaceae bacterium]|nr:ATP-binding cassette domain-containing protein [Propionibacteriaceae bacterium]
MAESRKLRHDTDAALRVCDLHKTFGRGAKITEALRGLSFEVPRGSVVSLLGANGAGKTTLVNIASTLLLPTSGTLTVCGTDVVADPATVRRHISLTGQFAAVDGELTGRENLIFFASLQGLSKAAARVRADELLRAFRLVEAANRRVATYSGGMRRRLDIAASLTVRPDLLFLDEPTTGLDPLSRRELWDAVDDLRDQGVSVLLTTQYLDEAERLSDGIVLLRGGRVVAQGTPGELRRQFGAPVCRLGFGDAETATRCAKELLPLALGRARADFRVESLEVLFTAHDGVRDLSRAAEWLDSSGIEVASASLNPPSLDEVFLGTAFAAAQEG